MSNPGQLHDGHEADRGTLGGFPAADAGAGDEGLPPAMPGALARALRTGYRGQGRGDGQGAMEREVEAPGEVVLTPCIELTTALNSSGYGHVRHEGKTVRANRLAYVKAHGLSLSDIAGQVVRHSCDNPACINPAHLLLGTHADNMRDMLDRGRNRQPKGSKNAKAKITDSTVIEIRRRIADGESHRAIARSYGIHASQISRINTGKTWGHVHG